MYLLMTDRVVFGYADNLVAILLIESRCLKTVGGKDGLPTPPGKGFLLCGEE